MTVQGHVLLVDDEPAFQRLGGAFLRAAGHRVTTAGDAPAALAAASADPRDVILLDLAMPPRFVPEDGLELIPRFAPAQVIVLTGHADHALALRAAELGAWDFLAKPADPEMLGFVVARALRKAALEAELRTLRQRESSERHGPARTPIILPQQVAPISLMTATSSLRKMPTTALRRLISPLNRLLRFAECMLA